MNILISTFSYRPVVGGVERTVARLSEGLIARGHHVTMVTGSATGSWFERDPRERPEVFRLDFPAPGWLPVRRRRRMFNRVFLAGLCRLRRIDLVHCHYLNVDTAPALRTARLSNIPCVLTLHGSELAPWTLENEGRKSYTEEILGSVTAVTTVSEALASEAAGLVPGVASRVRSIPNPVDPGAIRLQVGTSPGSAGPNLVFVGRLEHVKNIELLVDAFHALVERDPGFEPELRIVGSGVLEAPLRRRAEAGPGRERIHFMGSRSYEEVLGIIREARALVLPSHREGCPNVVLESMALGTPVVGSDAPGIAAMLGPGVPGRLFPRGDRRALEDAMRDVWRDPATREDRVAAAAPALERFATERILDQYCALYDELTVEGRHREGDVHAPRS